MSTRPTIERETALDFIARTGAMLGDRHPVIVLGIRGGLDRVAGENTIGGFDDMLVVVTADICEAFTGNCDPSSETADRANLKAGVSLFKMGFHHPGTPKQYAAFVQAAPVIVARWGTDATPAGTVDATLGTCLGGGYWQGWFEIHIHNAMGVNTTGSAGCQTIIADQWDDFYRTAITALRQYSASSFAYALYERTSADALPAAA